MTKWFTKHEWQKWWIKWPMCTSVSSVELTKVCYLKQPHHLISCFILKLFRGSDVLWTLQLDDLLSEHILQQPPPLVPQTLFCIKSMVSAHTSAARHTIQIYSLNTYLFFSFFVIVLKLKKKVMLPIQKMEIGDWNITFFKSQ